MEPDLSVQIGGVTLKNPVLTASGTCGYGEEYAPFMEARLYETLAAHCAEKQRTAAIFARSGFVTTPRGLIYW